MVATCRNYVTDGGRLRVWDLDRATLIVKLKQCLNLNKEYQASYQRTKKRNAEHPNGKRFEFSEMYIFGKFDTFCRRLDKVYCSLKKSQSFFSQMT